MAQALCGGTYINGGRRKLLPPRENCSLLGRIVVLSAIGCILILFLIVRHAYPDRTFACASLTIIGRKMNFIHTAIACSRPLCPEKDGIPLNNGIRTCIAISKPVNRLILRYPCNGDRHLFIIGIGYSLNTYRDEFVIRWPERGC